MNIDIILRELKIGFTKNVLIDDDDDDDDDDDEFLISQSKIIIY